MCSRIARLILKPQNTSLFSQGGLRIANRSPQVVGSGSRFESTNIRNPYISSTNKETSGSSTSTYTAYEQLGGSATASESSESESNSHFEEEDEEEQRFKYDILSLALNHVNAVGWSTDAIALAAEEAGLSPSVSSLFQDVDLVHFFISKSNRELEEYLAQYPSDPKAEALNAKHALEWRLKKLVPYSSNYADAIAIISRPENMQKSVVLLMEIADSVAHHALKCTSTDLSWYSKRFGIAGIYVATELCLVQDTSAGLTESWKFLDRRCDEFNKLGKGDLTVLPVPLPDLLNVGFTTLMNVIGRNARR